MAKTGRKKKIPDDWHPASVRWEPGVEAKIRAMAKKEHRTFSDQVRYLLEIALRELDKKREK